MSAAVEIEKLKAQVKQLSSEKADLEHRNNRLSANYDSLFRKHENLKRRREADRLKKNRQKALELFFKEPDHGKPGAIEKYKGEFRRKGVLDLITADWAFQMHNLKMGYEWCAPLEAAATALANAQIGFQDDLTNPNYFYNHGKGRARKGVQDQADDACLAYAMDVTIAAQDVQQHAYPPTRSGASRHAHPAADFPGPGLADKIVVGKKELEAILTFLKHLGLKGDKADSLRKKLIHTRKNKGKWSPQQEQFYRFLKKQESLMLEDGLNRGETIIETKRIIMENVLSRLKARHGWGNDKGGKCDLLR